MNSPQLPPGQQLAADHKWPVVGERQPLASEQPWQVSIAGLVRQPCAWSLDDLRQMPQVERTIDIHCVTRWSKLAMRFTGVPLAKLLAAAEPSADARFVSMIARSDREHSTSLPLRELLELDALMAFSSNGKPLATEHGGPVRVVVPGRYFYKSLKWLARIELLADERLGYWEAEAGYHNIADPWREERYIAAGVSRQEVLQLMLTKNFAARDLLSLDVAEHDLAGLNAARALLRNANFRGCNLSNAIFDEANLSNAHFENADLQAASFPRADLEGADFSGADLRGANFRGASLLGATFFDATSSPNFNPAVAKPARLDHTTQFDHAALEQLAPTQSGFLQKQSPQFCVNLAE